MTDEEEGFGDASARDEGASPPSLSDLVAKIRRRQDRGAGRNVREPTVGASDEAGNPNEESSSAESGFVYPADAAASHESLDSLSERAETTRTDTADAVAPSEDSRGDSPNSETARTGKRQDRAENGEQKVGESSGRAARRSAPDDSGGKPPRDSTGRATEDATSQGVLERVREASNVLIFDSGPHDTAADFCTDLLRSGAEPPEQLLLVTFTASPDERLDRLRRHLGTLPNDVAILNVGDTTRRGTSAGVETLESGGVTVTTVRDATDIQRIGLAINKFLSKWDRDSETALCFDSVSDLLGGMDASESVFRFLNVLLGRVRSGNVRAHYHMNPGAHGEEVLTTYRTLFEKTVRIDEDGSVRIEE